jgi:hypothetical protein
MDARRLGAAQEGPDILRILERIEDENEWRLIALNRSSEDVSDRRELAGLHDEGDALVPIKASQGGQRSTLELDDRDPQARRMEDELLERFATLGYDKEPERGPAGGERLLDWTATGHELFVCSEQIRWR